jgi:hypothetical protein
MTSIRVANNNLLILYTLPDPVILSKDLKPYVL